MRTRCNLLVLILSICFVLSPPPLLATLSPPVGVLLEDGSILAVNGEAYTNRLSIELPGGGELTSLAFNDNVWTLISLEQPPTGDLAPGTVLSLEFEVVPTDTEIPLELTGFWNGMLFQTGFDLSLQGYERENTARGVIAVEPLNLTPPAGWFNRVGPDNDEPVAVADSKAGNKDRTITVSGQFSYHRPDTTLSVPAYGVTAEVRDEDPVGSKLLGSAVVDIDGSYSVTFIQPEGAFRENNPDIFVYFKATNDAINVKANFVSSNVYRWKTSTHRNYSGTNLNFGSLTPADEDDHPALHILADITKAHQWFETRGYAPAAKAHAFWPAAASGASYTPLGLNWIFIPESLEWDEDTHIHEYGHHWMFQFSVDGIIPWQYCNGYEDDGPGCGHGDWCPENENEAWGEGVPDFFGDVISRAFKKEFNFKSAHFRVVWNNKRCTEDSPPAYHNPFITEGFVHALLYDVIDNEPNEESDLTADYTDALNRADVDEYDVLEYLVADTPQNVGEFIEGFRHTINNPSQFWETAANLSFFDIDTASPHGAVSITASSHEINVASADNTIELGWAQTDDDFSGTAGYSVEQVRNGTSHEYYFIDNDGAWINFTTNPLTPGTYYFYFQTWDAAGNHSGLFSVSGPYIIREPLPADIAYGQNLGAAQAGPLVIRDDDTALPGIIQWSDELPGDSDSVYWNIVTRNVGEEPVSDPFVNLLYVDGVLGSLLPDSITSLPGMTNNATVNLGPTTIPGGLHTVSVRYDDQELIAEPDETNNTTAVQLVFTPPLMSPGTVTTRLAPPLPRGGRSDFQDVVPVLRQSNQDGLRFERATGYHAVAVWADDNTEDYECSLYPPASSITQGFGAPFGVATSLGFSGRDAGLIDAVITNANLTLPHTEFDVGVLNSSEGEATYTAVHRVGSLVPLDTPVTLNFGSSRRLVLRTFDIDASSAGWKTASLAVDPAAGVFHMAWFPANFMYGALTDYSAHSVTDETGNLELIFDASLEGRHLLAVWRDPIDDLETKAAATLDFLITTSLPDLVMLEEPTNWFGPVVPRPDEEGTSATVFGPIQLFGNLPATFLNLNVFNQGKTDASSFVAEIEIDNTPFAILSMPACPSGDNSTINDGVSRTIRAGRHTLSAVIDPDSTLAEASVSNNRFAEQFVWLPTPAMSSGLSVHPAPHGAVAGWDAVTTLRGPLRYNSDGHLLEPQPDTWYGVAVQSGPASDVDLRLHEVRTDAKSGFGDPIAFSGWGIGQLDFLLVNTLATSARPFHIGVIGAAGTEDYIMDYISSVPLSDDPAGSYGPFELLPDELVQLREVTLSAGVYHIALNDEGTTDLMFSVHGGSIPYGTRSRPVFGGESFFFDGRSREVVDIEIGTSGTYCLAIWRRDGTGFTLPLASGPASYSLDFDSPSGVDDIATNPSRLRAGPNYPNPFNPSTTIQMSLATSGRTTVAVFDIAGKLVRTLLDEDIAAGTHVVTWTGQDSAGRDVATGLYFYRVKSGPESVIGRMTLVR